MLGIVSKLFGCGSILLSIVWLWEVPLLFLQDPLPLFFLPPSVVISFLVCKMPHMLFLQVSLHSLSLALPPQRCQFICNV